MALQPRDEISPGLGLARKPAMLLKAGDVTTLDERGLGEPRQEVVESPATG